jgi:hypothetical protein
MSEVNGKVETISPVIYRTHIYFLVTSGTDRFKESDLTIQMFEIEF